MKRLLITVGALMLLATSIFAQAFPVPTGPHMIGTTSFIIEDESREESFTDFEGDFRKLLIKAWYPAAVTGEVREPYIADYFRPLLLNKYKIPASEIEQFGLSHSYTDAPLNRAEDEYPVVIFVHGFGSTENDNVMIMEELASHGYIVYSINISYYSFFSVYQGEFITDYRFSNGFTPEEQQQLNFEFTQMLSAVKAADSPAEKQRVMAEFDRTNRSVQVYGEVSRTWVADTLFFIKTLDEAAPGNSLLNSLREGSDRDNIGMLGYSFGGNTATLLCLLEDSPIKAGINMDGKVNPPASQGYEKMQGFELERPFLLMSQDVGELSGVLHEPHFYGADEAVYKLTLKGTTHSNFSVLSYFPTLRSYGLTGTMSSTSYTEIMKGTMVPFFDTYLKGDEEAMENNHVQWRSDVIYQKRND